MKIFLTFIMMTLANVSFAEIDALGKEIIIQKDKPPQTYQLANIFLKGLDLKVTGTGCASSAFKEDNRYLRDEFSLAIGEAFINNSNYSSKISGSCEPDKYENADGVIDAWRCTVMVTTHMQKGKKSESVSSKAIDFGITKDSWKIIPTSLVCR